MGVRHRARRIGWALLGLAVLAIAGWILIGAISDRAIPEIFQHWTNWSNVMALVVAAIGAAIVAFDRIGRSPAPPDEKRTAQLLSDLALTIDREWAAEALRREVSTPAPMQVLWSSTGRPAASRQVVFNEEDSPDWTMLPLRGRLGGFNQDLVQKYLELPHRQLVVVGEPGAGKSVFGLLLTRGLIHERETDHRLPVPVLLPINTWDPREPVETFVIRRLVEDYADVLHACGKPSQIATRLVRNRQILPILDGLDELDTPAQTAAVKALELFTAANQPVVLTCRPEAYERMSFDVGVLSRAAVIELEPVRVQDAIAFLSQPTPDPRWEPVFEHLRQSDRQPLTSALSTPLMVALARTAFSDRSTNPADLLTLPTRSAITARLMDAFLNAIYARPTRPTRWLSCLAHHLDTTNKRDLRWWQIEPDLLAAKAGRANEVTVIVSMLLAALAGGVAGWFARDEVSIAAAAVAGAIIMVVVAGGAFNMLWPRAFPGWTPRRYRTRRKRRIQRTALWSCYGVIGGLLTGSITGEWIVSSLAGISWGLLASFVPVTWTSGHTGKASVRNDLRRNRRRVAAAGISHGLGSGLVCTLTSSALHISQARVVTATAAAVFAIQAGLAAGGWWWLRFRLTHLRLVRKGWLPVRLCAFLDDAYERGALRRAGSAYQFRHVLLQHHLYRTAYEQHLYLRASAGNAGSTWRLAELLAEQGRIDELRARADTGDHYAIRRLTKLLTERGRVNDAIAFLRARSDAGDTESTQLLVGLLGRLNRSDEAITLLRDLANTGSATAAWLLVELLVDQDRLDEAITVQYDLANTGHEGATRYLADLLAKQGRVDELRTLADTGLWSAARQLAKALAGQGRVEELRARADTGDPHATEQLADVLATQGRVEELRARADTGDPHATRRLATLLAERGRIDDAVAFLRCRADAGDRSAARRLAILLAGRGCLDEATALFQDLAGIENAAASAQLAIVLAKQGRVEELRTRADTGDRYASERLAEVLASRDWVEELRARADSGDQHAHDRLIDMLAAQGRLEELRALADVGDWYATERLVYLLTERGRIDDALNLLRARRDAGSWQATWRLVGLLVEQDRLDQATILLRDLADAGNRQATEELAEVLAKQGRVEELLARADAGDQHANKRLPDVLAQHGRVEELRARADSEGNRTTTDRYASALAGLLATLGRAEELRTRAEAGDWYAAERLVDLLTTQARLDEAIDFLRARVDVGDSQTVERLATVLAERGQLDEAIALLPDLVDRGGWQAIRRIATIAADQDRLDEAITVLTARADTGDPVATKQLADLLAEHDRTDELRARADAGEPDAIRRLAGVLIDRGSLDEAITRLRSRAVVEDSRSTQRLVTLLTEHGRLDEAIALLRDNPHAGTQLIDLLAEHGRVEELRARSDVGDWSAAMRLMNLQAHADGSPNGNEP